MNSFYDSKGSRDDGKVFQMPDDPGSYPNQVYIYFMGD